MITVTKWFFILTLVFLMRDAGVRPWPAFAGGVVLWFVADWIGEEIKMGPRKESDPRMAIVYMWLALFLCAMTGIGGAVVWLLKLAR